VELRDRIDYYEFLIGFIAHEVKNPLSAVVFFSRLMEEGGYGELKPRQREAVGHILANAARIEHMVEDFLNLTRLEGGGDFLRLEPLHLHRDVVDPVLEAMERKHLFAPDQRGRFVCESPGEVVVRGDRALLNVVFDNLFYNAVKYGREGGSIRYGWREDGDAARIHVVNEGLGVRKRDLKHIFVKFFRVRDPKMPERKGTGLGLYNVRRIVEMHRGMIEADSRYGRYFAIHFTLPLDTPG
jgi:signal transduction histidine kinase